MLSPVAKKWKKKVETITTELHGEQKHNYTLKEENIQLRAKLEKYEAFESGNRLNMAVDRQQLNSQVEWLRNLVEHLVIPAESIHARTTKEIRMSEMRNRILKEERKDRRVVGAYGTKEDVTAKKAEIKYKP